MYCGRDFDIVIKVLCILTFDIVLNIRANANEISEILSRTVSREYANEYEFLEILSQEKTSHFADFCFSNVLLLYVFPERAPG